MEDKIKEIATPEVPVQEQLKKQLLGRKLTISLVNLDNDIVEVLIVGEGLNLEGKAYKVPINNSKGDILLSVMYLEGEGR